MNWKQKFRRLLLLNALLIGLFGGAPLRPEEIEELMFQGSRQKQEQTIKQDEE